MKGLRSLIHLPLAGLVFAASTVRAQGAAVGGEDVRPLASASALSPATVVGGRSGALRVAVLAGQEELQPGLVAAVAGTEPAPVRWLPVLGTPSDLLGEPAFAPVARAPGTPGAWLLEVQRPDGVTPAPFTVLTEVPFSAKRGGRLNGYHIGTYPTEASGRSDRYAPPRGFVEVTPENQELQVSEHFRLRQFLTKDQGSVWPKYVALSLSLIDKLELVVQELHRMGIRADRVHVMSGFRTPQYNGPGGDGRALLSRHTYGDAADVWIDSDGDGQMDDLNGDGRVDIRDAEVMLRAVERVEQKHPELTGGAGVYRASDAHGPFIHIDVRGNRSRW